jgi:CRP/FNR family transcriptional regulator
MAGRDWQGRFPPLAGLAAEEQALLAAQARVLTLPAGSRLFGPGDAPAAMLLVLKGRARVTHMSEQGRELVLYRLEPGESCVLTTACLLAGEDYMATGLAETEVQALAIPRALFAELLARSAAFRDFVFTALSRRMTGIFRSIADVAFARLDVRLAERLLALAGAGAEIATTHQRLAAELGSAREVISRQLTRFEGQGWIAVRRGRISLVNRTALTRLASGR